MSKRFFIGANFKMNERPMELELECAEGKKTAYHATDTMDIVVFPTFLELRDCLHDGLRVGAQWGHPYDSGAFTGDVSMAMLAGMQVTHVLCGHSERRRFHHETDAEIADQVSKALEVGLIPVLCIGETAEEREMGKTEEILRRQLSLVLALSASRLTPENFIVAYEPLWAISGGDAGKPAAKAGDAQKAHIFIRGVLSKNLQSMRIIYGGSMKASNSRELLSQPDIDGGLVGGCSLKPEEFRMIVEASNES